MIHILVTGANGQLGSEVRERAPAFKELQFYFTDIGDLDILDLMKLKSFFNSHKIDWIINAAAYTAVDKAETEKVKAEAVNVTGVRHLVKLATNYRSKLIHISTDYVFGGMAKKPYTENDTVNPQGYYAKTKLDSETEARRYAHALIIRTAWLYSSYGTNFVKTILKLGRDRGSVNVVNNQKGSPTWANDLAGAILHIISISSSDPALFKPGIYHYANEGECTWFEFAKEIFNLTGLPCTVNPITSAEYPTIVRRPAYSVLNSSKIKSTYHLNIPHWKESLQACLEKIKM